MKFALWAKIKHNLRSSGHQLLYSVLLLYYSFTRRETPSWAKNIIRGVLGYFILPMDSIPDLTPLVGYTDDMGLLSLGLVAIASYINDDVRIKARKTLKSWTGSLDLEVLNQIDKRL